MTQPGMVHDKRSDWVGFNIIKGKSCIHSKLLSKLLIKLDDSLVSKGSMVLEELLDVTLIGLQLCVPMWVDE